MLGDSFVKNEDEKYRPPKKCKLCVVHSGDWKKKNSSVRALYINNTDKIWDVSPRWNNVKTIRGDLSPGSWH